MTYYLDSNIIVYFIKGLSENVRDTLRKQSPKDVKIPSVVKAELLVGAYKSQNVKKNLEVLEQTLSLYEVVPFDDVASEIYGKFRAKLEAEGKIIGPNDLFIAATVLSRGGILVTNNTKEFSRVEGLQLDNWCR